VSNLTVMQAFHPTTRNKKQPTFIRGLLDLSVLPELSVSGLGIAYTRRLLRGKSLFRKTTGRFSERYLLREQEESTNLRNPGSVLVVDPAMPNYVPVLLNCRETVTD
jgi:hypothetical protein